MEQLQSHNNVHKFDNEQLKDHLDYIQQHQQRIYFSQHQHENHHQQQQHHHHHHYHNHQQQQQLQLSQKKTMTSPFPYTMDALLN